LERRVDKQGLETINREGAMDEKIAIPASGNGKFRDGEGNTRIKLPKGATDNSTRRLCHQGGGIISEKATRSRDRHRTTSTTQPAIFANLKGKGGETWRGSCFRDC